MARLTVTRQKPREDLGHLITEFGTRRGLALGRGWDPLPLAHPLDPLSAPKSGPLSPCYGAPDTGKHQGAFKKIRQPSGRPDET